VNGYLLSSNVTISASDITTGTLAVGQLPAIISANQINGSNLSSLATGILKNTTSTGVPTIAVAGTDYVAPSGNITGTAANLSGTPALPNGTTATTQTTGDNSTKLATTAYVSAALTSVGASTVGIAGAFRNLVASATGLNTNVSVTADEVMLENSSNYYVTVRGVSLTIACTTSGANGLDTNTVAASTWYSVWVINNGTTTAGLLSLSATAPTLPSGYTYKARVGWIKTGSGSPYYPLAFKQLGRRVQYMSYPPLIASGTAGSQSTPTWVAVTVSGASIPTTASVIHLIVQVTSAGGSNNYVMVAPNNSYGAYNSTTNPPPYVLDTYLAAWTQAADMLLESSSIYWISGSSLGQIFTHGWEDNL
jgi:hypothetical protein